MKTQSCTWNGVTAMVYHLHAGEKIGRHGHIIDHTTMVLAGAVMVREEGFPSFTMRPDSVTHVLIAGRQHEIEAIEAGTMVLNMIAGDYGAATGEAAAHGEVITREIT